MKKITLRHNKTKLLKKSNKEKNLKNSQRKEHITFRETKIKMTVDFSSKLGKQEVSEGTSLKH